ncbi:hypothetical protein F511_31093 [Dorcoceras hygrometricum]|uniref:Uncharacterized protein n=1 Tax=Dorcoceras hygrometricum TaxID=472368 RepID=A0A2Z7A8J5_9LAMI|nr:hypothetical protein F511_31093 [Dorcoceras hygrometricum]
MLSCQFIQATPFCYLCNAPAGQHHLLDPCLCASAESIHKPSADRSSSLQLNFLHLLIVMTLLMSSSLSAPADLYRSSPSLRLFLASVPAGPLAPADLSSSAEHDVVTNDIIIDGPLRCSSWFSFDVPADPSSSSACSWFISFQLIHFAPAGSTWPPPDYEQLIQLWTSPLLIQLPSK